MKNSLTFYLLVLIIVALCPQIMAQDTIASKEYPNSVADRYYVTVDDTLFNTADTSVTATYAFGYVESTATFVRKYTQANDSVYVDWAIQGYDANTASWYNIASGTDSVVTAIKTNVTLEPFTKYREWYGGASAKNGININVKSTFLMNKVN